MILNMTPGCTKMRAVFILAVLLIFLAGCSVNNNNNFACNEPYIEAWNGVNTICCLDLDHDNVCDSLKGAVEVESTTYYLEVEDGLTLEDISRQRLNEKEQEDMYDVKKAVWDSEKEDREKEEEDEELLEEFS